MKIEIPDKLYFKIGEVAKMADVPPHVLRYWESEFSAIRPKRASSKQRLYRREDVLRILQIKTLLHEQGYTIAGARKFIASGEKISQTQKVVQQPKSDMAKALGSIKNELLNLRQFIEKKR